jgi:phage FluMu gp28-like protein
LRLVKMIRGVARVPDERTTGKDGNKRHGDAAISIAMMHYASRHPGAEIAWEALPTQPRGFDNRTADDGGMRMRADDSDFALPESKAW